jgi:hypothetical protein
MLRIALLVLSLALPSTLWAQYASGTVVVLEVGGDYIVVAADSLRLGPGPGQVSHSACKILKLSDQFVFAASGLEAHPGIAKTLGSNAWNVKDIAKQEYAALGKKHTDQWIQKLAAAYGERLSGQINHDLKLEPTGGPLMTYLTKHQGGGAAVFAGFDEKLQRVIVEVKVAIQSPGARSVGYTTKLLPSDSAGGTEVLGDTAIAQELAAGRSQRAQEWRSAMLLQSPAGSLKDSLIVGAESVAEWTAKYDPGLVGGPIDVILVTRKRGVTWVRRKQSCALVAAPEKSAGSQR